MATTVKNNKAAKEAAEVKTDSTATVNPVLTEPVQAKKPEKKKYEPSDGIPCKSITPGKLFMEGLKSHIVYRWIGVGDVIDVEYQDLLAAIRSAKGYVMKPFFIIEDKELVSQFPQIVKLYESLYSVGDLRNVLTKLNPKQMKETILALPVGAQESIKHMASKMISTGALDSVQKIKCLDEIFGTEMMLMTGLFNTN